MKVLVAILMKEHCLSKNRSRFANRPSWAALQRALNLLFSLFSNEIGKLHYLLTMQYLQVLQ